LPSTSAAAPRRRRAVLVRHRRIEGLGDDPATAHFKEQHGQAVDVTPTGATGRETQFIQSYRAEWMYFLAVIKAT